MLNAHQVTKDYQIRVLDHIDVSINDEEFVAIMPSGSGKSTLLHALSGLDRPTSGTVSIDDRELTDLSEAELAQLRLVTFGFVFQQPHLLSSLSVLDNVVLPGFLAKQEPRQTIVERGRELMERVGIADLADRAITEASRWAASAGGHLPGADQQAKDPLWRRTHRRAQLRDLGNNLGHFPRH